MTKFKSKLSWVPVVSFALVIISFVISTLSANTIYTNVTADDTPVTDFSTRPLVSVPMMLAGVFALVAVATGLITIIKYKERSVWVFVATIISSLLVLMTIVELIFQG